MNTVSPSAVNPIVNQSELTMLWIRTTDCSVVPLEIMQHVSYKILTFNWYCVYILGEESKGTCKISWVWNYTDWLHWLCKWVMMNTEGKVKILLFLWVATAYSKKETNTWKSTGKQCIWNGYPFHRLFYIIIYGKGAQPDCKHRECLLYNCILTGDMDWVMSWSMKIIQMKLQNLNSYL